MDINSLDQEQLANREADLSGQYAELKAAGLDLDITRGKPSSAQLDLSNDLDGILDGFYLTQNGTDVRNYGGILGIPEARALGGEFLDLPAEQVLVGGSSSLTLMYHYVEHMLSRWREESETVRFITPVPGYDRHFTICESLGIEMVNVPFTREGPDMDAIEQLCAADPAIKGIWCVPKYSNPTGHTYSEAVVRRFAELPRKAGADFRIMWDNAYSVHHLFTEQETLADLMTLAETAGTSEHVVMLASTSKVTFAGSGISFLGATQSNLASFEAYLSSQLIGFDKVNQLRHAKFLTDVSAHMARHAEIIRPKFEMVQAKLEAALGGRGVATWTQPRGGYFVSLDTTLPIADTVVRLAAEVGVKLTPAGATFPNGEDPDNQNIRIAPTFPALDALETALDVLVLCVELAAVRSLINS